MRFWIFIGILWAGILYTFLVGPERAHAVIHPLHTGMSILVVVAVVFAFFAVVGLFRFLKVVLFLGLAALVLAVLIPICSLVVASHPFGPVVGVAFLMAILIRGLSRHAE